jgi:hypothetical protein
MTATQRSTVAGPAALNAERAAASVAGRGATGVVVVEVVAVAVAVVAAATAWPLLLLLTAVLQWLLDFRRASLD